MTRVAVDLELLADLLDRMAAFEQRFAVVRDDVDARMRRTRAVWTGAAADAQAAVHERWVVGAREMHEGLTALHSIAGTARENYASAVQANRQMWSHRG
jgi:WXG100 family type VII secretion target